MLHDGRAAGIAMLDRGSADVDPAGRDAYGAGVQSIVDAAAKEYFFDHLGTYIENFFKLAYEHKVRLDHNYICVALAVKVMEGLAIKLDPKIDLLHAATHYVAIAGKNEKLRDLQAALKDSLTWKSRDDA